MNSRIKRFGSLLFCTGCLMLIALSAQAAPELPPEVEYPHDQGTLVLDGKPVPISDDLQDFLTREGYSVLHLINDEGQVKVVNAEGQPIEPCGRVVGTEITGNCDLDGIDVVNTTTISILGTTSEASAPKPCHTEFHGGYILQEHKRTRIYKGGLSPCDARAAHKHN